MFDRSLESEENPGSSLARVSQQSRALPFIHKLTLLVEQESPTLHAFIADLAASIYR